VRFESDVLAHVSGVRDALEEDRVFPVEGFHGDQQSRGPDPRFGSVHALYALVAEVAGLEPLTVWHQIYGPALLLIVLGLLALLEASGASRVASTFGVAVLPLAYGGLYSNLLEMAAYPLWFGLGLVWLLAAIALGPLDYRTGARSAVIGVGLAACIGIHYFAFVLASFLLLMSTLAAPTADLKWKSAMVARGLLLSLPFAAVRTAATYANQNPIHHRVWESFAWSDGWYSADPIFVFQWLMPLGIVALAWFGAMTRRHWELEWTRWMALASFVTLFWLAMPFLLTPSMKILGFLPLRMVMAVPLPFLVAFLVDRYRSNSVVRGSVGIVALVFLILPTALPRLKGFAPVAEESVLDSAAWSRMIEVLEDSPGRPVRVLSDPYSMLAVRATSQARVVAVPDGRSSPRDPVPVERLRDAWRAMSPATAESEIDSILAQHEVSHVLVNLLLPHGLISYEYPIHGPSLERQLIRFEERPAWFRKVFAGDGLALFEVLPGAEIDPAIEDTWSCDAELPEGSVPRTPIGDGYALLGAQVYLSGPRTEAGRVVRVRGALVWEGEGPPPDRQLIVRLDHEGDGASMPKPVRKLREKLGGGPWRYRWTTSPGSGQCPLWYAGEARALELDLSLPIPDAAPPGDWGLHVAARDLSVFVPVRFKDMFSDDDSYQGPRIGAIRLDAGEETARVEDPS
jgi:hypothetical protein